MKTSEQSRKQGSSIDWQRYVCASDEDEFEATNEFGEIGRREESLDGQITQECRIARAAILVPSLLAQPNVLHESRRSEESLVLPKNREREFDRHALLGVVDGGDGSLHGEPEVDLLHRRAAAHVATQLRHAQDRFLPLVELSLNVVEKLRVARDRTHVLHLRMGHPSRALGANEVGDGLGNVQHDWGDLDRLLETEKLHLQLTQLAIHTAIHS